MSKSKSSPAKPADKNRGSAKKSPEKPAASSSAAIRETVESIVIAFVLAFLFRTFEAEAFVIPTGSMAPTLMGRHKDLDCPKCGYPYQVSASEEVDAERRQRRRRRIGDRRWHLSDVPPARRHPQQRVLPVVQRRPHPGRQVRLPVRRSASGGT